MSLEHVKVGDFLAITGGSWHRTLKKEPVTRVTKTIVEAGGRKFNRRGYERGASTWSSCYADLWDDEKHNRELSAIQAESRHRTLAAKIRDTSFRDMPLEKLEQIWAIIEESK